MKSPVPVSPLESTFWKKNRFFQKCSNNWVLLYKYNKINLFFIDFIKEKFNLRFKKKYVSNSSLKLPDSCGMTRKDFKIFEWEGDVEQDVIFFFFFKKFEKYYKTSNWKNWKTRNLYITYIMMVLINSFFLAASWFANTTKITRRTRNERNATHVLSRSKVFKKR